MHRIALFKNQIQISLVLDVKSRRPLHYGDLCFGTRRIEDEQTREGAEKQESQASMLFPWEELSMGNNQQQNKPRALTINCSS